MHQLIPADMAVATAARRVIHRTRGVTHGPISRLMSPSDLGQTLKPFVFLDLFNMDLHDPRAQMPIHPHSGIATITVLAEGDLHFDDARDGSGTIAFGAFECMRAGNGVWHGKEMSAGKSARVRGFQLAARCRTHTRSILDATRCTPRPHRSPQAKQTSTACARCWSQRATAANPAAACRCFKAEPDAWRRWLAQAGTGATFNFM